MHASTESNREGYGISWNSHHVDTFLGYVYTATKTTISIAV